MRLLRGRPRVAEVVLVTRQGCHLCELAAPVVRREAERAGAGYAERDVDASPADVAAYGEKVPVVLLDGTEHAYWQIDEKALRTALRSGV
ncbi:MAG TPA: glutaredoxin family protein [Mycobacteriales bacterium]|jgi:glutaredoxin|nr:glutaredoxin family protein [Mycobacteriales bacterium]